MKNLKTSLLAVSAVAIALSLTACNQDGAKTAEPNTVTTPAPAQASAFANKVDFEKIKGPWYSKNGSEVDVLLIEPTKDKDVIRGTLNKQFDNFNLNLSPNEKFDKNEMVMASHSTNKFMMYDDKNDVMYYSNHQNVKYKFTRNKE